MPEQPTTPSTEGEASVVEFFVALTAAPQGTVVMKCHGGMWKILTPWGEAEGSSLARAIELSLHRGLWEP